VSRSPTEPRRIESGAFLVCCAGSTAVHRGEGCLVFVDGNIENLDRVARRYGLPPRSDSATDAPLVADLWRVRSADLLPELEGSFALVLIDEASNEVHLAKDALGARPLFFASWAGGWSFASEMKCLVPLLERSELDTEALEEAMHYRWLLGKRTLIRGVEQVLPASAVTLRPGHSPRSRRLPMFRFTPTEDGSLSVWRQRVDEALTSYLARKAQRYRRVAVLLSGGVDSSLLAAKAREAGFDRLVAITARFPGHANPELQWAKRVARHIAVEHRVVDVEDSQVRSFFPRLVWRMETPPRHFQSFALARLLREVANDVDAVLDGNAADALFGTREMVVVNRQAAFDRIPAPLRRILRVLAPTRARGCWAGLSSYLASSTESLILGDDAVPYATPLSRVVPGLSDQPTPSADVRELYNIREVRDPERFQGFHIATYTRNHAEKMDRLASPLGLEVLAPFLSPEVMEVAIRLPERLKVAKELKVILKDLVASHYPRDWMSRRKQPFPVPIRDWVVGALEPFVALLRDERTLARGIFDVQALCRLDPQTDFQLLRTCASLEIFLRQFIDDDPEAIPDGVGDE
jgi:asparagine synthase (glutamine-hydrolysing)